MDKQRDNLRDHMNDLELIFTMLGEASTTEIAKNRDAQGFQAKSTAGFRPEERRNDNLLILSCRKGSVRHPWV